MTLSRKKTVSHCFLSPTANCNCLGVTGILGHGPTGFPICQICPIAPICQIKGGTVIKGRGRKFIDGKGMSWERHSRHFSLSFGYRREL
jgi:hypothetical protein